jgi:hypothetical protein
MVTMNPRISRVLLTLSALGSAISQQAIKRFGRPGAIGTAAVVNAVLVRDATLLATGATRQLKRGPACLLVVETALAGLASVFSIRLVCSQRALDMARGQGSSTPEVVRKAALTALFAVHTGRYSIALRPDHGQRTAAETSAAAGAA